MCQWGANLACQVPTSAWRKGKGQAAWDTAAWLWQGLTRSGPCRPSER